MNAYKCDRCHEFYTDNPEMTVNTVRCTYRGMHITSTSLSTGRLDLCPKCKKSFSHWFLAIVEEAKL